MRSATRISGFIFLLALILNQVAFLGISGLTDKAAAADAQTSTIGTEFHFALPEGPSWTGTNHVTAGWTLFMSSTETGTATIYWGTGTSTVVNIYGGQVTSQTVSTTNTIATSQSGIQSSRVIKVVSTVGISMYGCDMVEAASDCTNFFPSATWGTKYRLLYGKSDNSPQKFTIFTADETATITINAKTSFSASPTSFTANTPVSITLGPRQAYVSKLTTLSQEFSGTLITSTAKIGIINGHECSSAAATFSGTGGACDTGAQFVPPVSAWGSSYYSVNYQNTGATGSGYRVMADQDSTTVTIAGDESATVQLQAGEIYQIQAFKNTGASPNKSISITANNPILVSHWLFAGTYSSIEGGDNGDQSMSYLTPFQQFMNKYLIINPNDFKGSFINLVVPTAVAATITIDGSTVDQSLFRTIANSSWKSAQVKVKKGTHLVSSTQAFGIEIYGIGYYDSYAYTGGQSTSNVSSIANLSLNSYSISGVVGQSACLPVIVQDAYGAPVGGVRVDAVSTGVNGSQSFNATSDSQGIAQICYVGTNSGTDNIQASVNGFSTSGSINWTLTLPAFSYTPSSVSLAVNTAMPLLTPTSTGGKVDSWSISPSLPAGLSINSATGVISGTPTSTSSSTTYTVTASNATGSTSGSISLEVTTPVIPTISYSPSTRILTLDTATPVITPVVTGTFPTWSISPVLPSGLNFSTQSGQISGTPSVTSSVTNYTITASNSAGSVSTTLTLSVIPTAPSITFSPTSLSTYLNYAIATLTPRNTGSPATSWAISPSLPAGLSFNSTTGAISGTPSATSSLTSYTVTGTNSAGSSSATVSIEVIANISLPSISISPSTQSFTLGVMINSITPTNSGGPVSSWSISPALPTGLSINSSTGRISGTPTATKVNTAYTITATNSAGSSTSTINITVALPAAPDISFTPNSYNLTKNAAITPISPNNLGGGVTSYSISPSLPTGLSIDTVIGQISGTPTVDLSSTVFTVTATNSGGSDTATVTLYVGTPRAPSIVYLPSSQTVVQFSSITAMSPTNSGGDVTSYSVSPALPTGIVLNSATGRISGTPSVVLGATNFTVTALNGVGSSTATIILTVTSAGATISSPTISGNVYKGVVTVLVVSTSGAGKVTFFANDKRIANCVTISAVDSGGSFSASCNWKPTVQGLQVTYAQFKPQSGSAVNSTKTSAWVLKRSGTR